MSANTDRGAGKVFSNAAILTGVIVLIGLLAALKSTSPEGVTWMMWSMYIAAPVCLVLLIMAVVLLVKKSFLRALVVLLMFLPAVPLVVMGLPVYRVNQAVQATAQRTDASRSPAASTASKESGKTDAEVRGGEAGAQKQSEK